VRRCPDECAFLEDFGRRATGGKLDRLRSTWTMKSMELVNRAPPHETTPLEYQKTVMTIRGHDVAIFQPVTGVRPPQWLPDTGNMANALATLSDRQLRGMREAWIVPHACTGVTDRSCSTDIANHQNGIIAYYPRGETHPQSDIDWVFQHESAHNIWDQEVAKDRRFPAQWQAAMDTDGHAVSAYARSRGKVEDFADFMILYADVIGTPCEGCARALFPKWPGGNNGSRWM
jgi:hypothetical protein